MEKQADRNPGSYGCGLNPEQCHAERIDGYNPLAVIDAIARKREILRNGEGPVLLDTITYRFSGHSPSDASSYREKTEIEEWQQVDSLVTYKNDLLTNGVTTEGDLEKLYTSIDDAILRAFQKAIDLDASPRADLYVTGNLLEKTMFSNERVVSFDPERKPDALLTKEENPRVKSLADDPVPALGENGETLPKTAVSVSATRCSKRSSTVSMRTPLSSRMVRRTATGAVRSLSIVG